MLVLRLVQKTELILWFRDICIDVKPR
jgi:hypothetical protein